MATAWPHSQPLARQHNDSASESERKLILFITVVLARRREETGLSCCIDNTLHFRMLRRDLPLMVMISAVGSATLISRYDGMFWWTTTPQGIGAAVSW